MAERNDMTAALVTAYTSPQLAAINEYMGAEKAVRAAAETLGLDADLMIAEAEGGTGYDIFKRGGPLFRGRSSHQRKAGGERPCLTISPSPPNSTA